MKSRTKKPIPYKTKGSLTKASEASTMNPQWVIVSEGKEYSWSNTMERVEVIRKGIPYDTIELISKRLNRSVKAVLSLIGIAQTTYNKKKSERSLLDCRNSELIISITELIDYGQKVFNGENDKFERWLKKNNISLGGKSPESLLDTITGIDEVNHCLNRIEYGNFA